jgi:hypothetical protein
MAALAAAAPALGRAATTSEAARDLLACRALVEAAACPNRACRSGSSSGRSSGDRPRRGPRTRAACAAHELAAVRIELPPLRLERKGPFSFQAAIRFSQMDLPWRTPLRNRRFGELKRRAEKGMK